MSRLGILTRPDRGGSLAGAPPHSAPPRPGWARRRDAARSILAWVGTDLDRAGSIADHPAVQVFGGLDGALRHMHRRWVTGFGVALDEELEAGALPDPATMARVCRRLGAEQPELTRILADHSSHPAVREGRENHRRLLADAAGGPTRGG